MILGEKTIIKMQILLKFIYDEISTKIPIGYLNPDMVLSLSGIIRARENILNKDSNEKQCLACEILKHIIKLQYLKLWETVPTLSPPKKDNTFCR